MARTLKQVAGRTGAYVRSSSVSIYSITATPAEMRQEVLDTAGLGTGVFVYGLLFTAADLTVGGVRLEPRSGDRFEETYQLADIAWEAMPPGPKQPVFEWADASGILLMVWFKKVKR